MKQVFESAQGIARVINLPRSQKIFTKFLTSLVAEPFFQTLGVAMGISNSPNEVFRD
jgi:hypothetical protein